MHLSICLWSAKDNKVHVYVHLHVQLHTYTYMISSNNGIASSVLQVDNDNLPVQVIKMGCADPSGIVREAGTGTKTSYTCCPRCLRLSLSWVVCICACVRICVRACVRACGRACARACVCVCVCVCVSLCVRV